jgi:hypothetical protein
MDAHDYVAKVWGPLMEGDTVNLHGNPQSHQGNYNSCTEECTNMFPVTYQILLQCWSYGFMSYRVNSVTNRDEP